MADDVLTVGGAGQIPSWSFDMSSVNLAESRLSEVAYVNQRTAPELAAVFNMGANECGKALAKATLAYTRTMRAVDRRAAVVSVDLAKDILAEKGLTTTKTPAGSDTLRQAIVEMDREYQELVDRADQLEAIQKLLQVKFKTLERAFWQVRKVSDPQATEFDNEAGKQPRPKFGSPNY